MLRRHARSRLGTALGLAAVLAWGGLAPANAQRRPDPDGWSLTREPPRAASAASAREPTPARLLAAALRDPDQTYLAERLLRAYERRDGSSEAGLGEIEALARAAKPGSQPTAAAASQRAWLLHAQLHWLRGQPAHARDSFLAAQALGPSAQVLRRFAAFERAQRALPRARTLLEQALPLERRRIPRAELERELAELCLELADDACARVHFDALARAQPADLDQLLLYPRALVARRAPGPAAEAYEARLAGWRGSAIGAATIRLELGRARLAAGDLARAHEQLERARRSFGPARAPPALLELLLEAHRGLGTLEVYARELVKNRSSASQRLAGRALEELAQPAAALAAYRRALAQAPGDAALAERVLALLQREGRSEELRATYERLLAQPNPNPQWLAELCELLRALGRPDDALELAARTGRSHPRDAGLHELLVELYTRWQQPERARAELEQLVRIEPGESRHILALAELELAQGREARAVAVLERLRVGTPGGVSGHVRLGHALADHDFNREALAEFERALRLAPASLEAMRGRALALARLYRHRDSEAQWQAVLASSAGEPERAREAREQLVQIWAELGELERRVRDYEGLFGYVTQSGANEPRRRAASLDPSAPAPRVDPNAPPDPEAGRMLAEAYQRLARQPLYRSQPARYLRAAEDVLGRVVKLDPSDTTSWHALERLRVRRGDRDSSIAALEQLVTLEPSRAGEHWMRMAEHARAAFQTDAAIAHARRALELAPADPAIHEWLGDVFRSRRDAGAAVYHYGRALEADPQRYELALRLAELLARRGEADAAAQRLRHVLRGAADPALVLRAGRAELQAATSERAQLELEREWFALASSAPRRAELRQLLIELYEAMLPRLAPDAGTGVSQPAASLAPLDSDALAAVRARAQKPLLDALLDREPAQVQSAVRLLHVFGSSVAAVPLMALAEGTAAPLQRRRALEAACALGGEELLARQLALALGPEPALRDMAAFCIARAPSRAAGPALRKLAQSETPAVRAFALLGLGKLGAPEQPTTLDTLRFALSHDPSAWVRGSAAIALGLFGDSVAREPLLAASRASDASVAESATLALGLLGDPSVRSELADSLFGASEGVAEASDLALHALACGARIELALSAPEPDAAIETLLRDARAALASCATSSLVPSLELLEVAVRRALQGPEPQRAAALGWLERISAARPSEPVGPDASWRDELLGSLVSELGRLARQRAPGVRLQVARLLARVPAAESMLVAMVGDPHAPVRSAALEALVSRSLPDRADYLDRVAAIADADPELAVRRRAVAVLGAMQGERPTSALLRVLASDPFALVRESAAEALAERERDPAQAGPGLLIAARSDVERRVRVAAARALRRVGGPALADARGDRLLSPTVREILRTAPTPLP